MKLRTLLLASIFAFGTVHGQTINLLKDYSLRVFQNPPLKDTYTIAQAKSKYPNYWTWMTYHGATDAQCMSVDEAAVAWNEAVWKTDGYVAGNVGGAWPKDGNTSRAIIDASGIYYISTQVPLTISMGQYIGAGTGNYTELTTANGGPGTTGGTRIAIDHAGWLKDIFPARNAIQSASWGDNSFYGYSESFVVRGFRLEGGMDNKAHDPSFESSGIAIWDSGETSRVEYVFASNFNDAGFHNVRGTPSIFFGCSAFSNRRYGFWLDGSSLSTVALYSPSGDDNGAGDGSYGAFIGGGSGYGRPGGGTLTIISAKLESDNVQGRMNGHQRFLDLTGLWNVVVVGASVYSKTTLPEAISIDWQDYAGSLDISGVYLIGFKDFAKITSHGKTVVYKSPGNYVPFAANINEQGCAFASRDIGQAASPVVPPIEPPAPSSDTIAYYTFDGISRSNITATVGENMLAIYSAGAMANSVLDNSGAHYVNYLSYPVQWDNVRKVTLLGFAADKHGGLLMCDSTGQQSIRIMDDGSVVAWYANYEKREILPVGTIKFDGMPRDVALPLPEPMRVRYFGQRAGQGGGWSGTLDGLLIQ